MRSLIIAASILLCAIPAGPAALGAPAPVAAPAPELLKLAAEVQRTGPKLARLWPGYWPPGQAFIIYRPGVGALLVSDEAGPPAFEPLPAASLPRPLRGRAWFRAGHLDGIDRPFVIGYPIGGERTAVLVLADAGAKDLPTLIFHEQFHHHQIKAFRKAGASQFVSPKAVPDRVAFAAAAETERRVLAAAIVAKPGTARNRLLHQYLALRRQRERGLAPEVLGVERHFERIEGTAKFVDRAAAALAPGARLELPALLAELLREDLGRDGQPYLAAWFRTRSYGVGAALTFLLRGLDPKGWRAAIEGGAALDERLAALTGFDSSPDPAGLAETARAAFGHAAIHAALAPGIRAGEKKEIKSVEEFHALGAHRLRLEVSMPRGVGGGGGGLGFATGPGGMVLLGQAHLVLPDPRMVSATLPSASLVVRGRPFMSEGGKTSRYTIMLPSPPSLNGRTGLAAGEHGFDRLEAIADGVEIRVRRPVTVTVSELETIIRIR